MRGPPTGMARRRPRIRVGEPRVDRNRVAVHIDAGGARQYLRSGWFLVEYGDLDVSGVDPSILVIPALGTVLPIAYATGATVAVPAVDGRYAQAARELAPVWQEVYPRFRAASFALEAEPRENHPGTSGGAAMLYSGGLDSTATLIGRSPEITTLLTIWGADVGLDDPVLWRGLDRHLRTSDLAAGRHRVVARSNLRRFPVEMTLVHDFLSPEASWWGSAHHGMGMIGIAAPVAVALGAGVLLVPASYSPLHDEPNGSMKRPDELHRWGDTTVEHEGFELSRQGKVDQRIAPHLRSGGTLRLAVCYQDDRAREGGTLNCGRCEKCLRTAAGLLVAGIDPSIVGLVVDDGTYLHWAGLLSGGQRVLGPRSEPFWSEIRDALVHAPQRAHSEAQERFLEALRECRPAAAFEEATDSHRPADELKYRIRRALPDRLEEPAAALLTRLRATIGHPGRIT